MKADGPGKVHGDDGLEIYINFQNLMYKKRERRLRIGTVFMEGYLNIGLSLEETWLPPNASEQLDDEHKSEIENDLLEAMRILGIPAKII